jgi:hypothetical protein
MKPQISKVLDAQIIASYVFDNNSFFFFKQENKRKVPEMLLHKTKSHKRGCLLNGVIYKYIKSTSQ